MGLESPVALAFLAAAAVPILIQLRPRRRARPAPFPNVEIASGLGRGTLRARVVSEGPLLVARALTVAFAVATAAGPYIGGSPPEKGRTLAEGDIVVLLDRSSSWRDRVSFDEAVGAAREVLRRASPHGRAILVPFDDLPGPALEGAQALAALESMAPSGRAADPASALAAAGAILRARHGREAGSSGTVVLLTPVRPDKEANTPDADAVSPQRDMPFELTGSRVVVFAPGPPPESQGAGSLVALEVFRPQVGGRSEPSGSSALEPRFLRVRLRPAGPPGGEELRLYLDDADEPASVVPLDAGAAVAGRDRAELELSLPAPRAGSSPRILTAELAPRGAGRRVTVGGPAGRRSLLLAGGGPARAAVLATGGARAGDCLVLRRAIAALAAASRESRAIEPLEAEPLDADALSATALARFDAAVVADCGELPAVARERLADFVRSGGALLGFAPGGLETAAELFGVRRGTEGGVLQAAALGEPGGVPSPWRASFDRQLPRDAPVSGLDDPGRILEYRIGNGRAVFLAAGAGELQDRPSAFLPLLDGLLERALAPPVGRTVIDAAMAPLVVRIDEPERVSEVRAVSPSLSRIELRPYEGAGDSRGCVLVPCDEPGLWRVIVRRRGSDAEFAEHLIGVNPSRRHPPRSRRGVGPRWSDEGIPAAGRQDARLVRSRAELISTLGGRGGASLSPFLALAMLAAAGAELALSTGSRRRAPAAEGRLAPHPGRRTEPPRGPDLRRGPGWSPRPGEPRGTGR